MNPITEATLNIQRLPLATLQPHPRNPRNHPEPDSPAWQVIEASLKHDYFDPIVWNVRNGQLVSGHLRSKVLARLGFTAADCVVVDYDEPTHIARMLAANKLTGEDDVEAQKVLLAELNGIGGFELNLTGFDQEELDDLGIGEAEPKPPEPMKPEVALVTLAERFGVPPFSILDARQGYWQDRKRAWLALGIKSEVGRGEGLTMSAEQVTTQGLNFYRNKEGALLFKGGAQAGLNKLMAEKKTRKANATLGGSAMPATDYKKSQAPV